MTRREVVASSPEEMCKRYPIEGKVPNWYFRAQETSSNAWLVEGCDIWGRKVSRTGGDPDALLEECAADALAINTRLAQQR